MPLAALNLERARWDRRRVDTTRTYRIGFQGPQTPDVVDFS